MPHGVLVTDGMQRKSLAAVRALGEAGEKVVAAEWTAFAAALFSKYAGRARMAHPSGGGEAVARSVARICETRGLDVILAMEETTLLSLLRHRGALPRTASLPFPNLELVEWARDKERTLASAAKLGIPIPLTTCDPSDLKTFPLPAVVKPRTSSGAVGLKYASTRAGLETAYGEVSAVFPRPLIQERLPGAGEGIGVSAFFGDSGRLHAFFTHRRIREYPVSGGASTLRESARDRAAEEAALSLLGSAGWRGVAMAEFKRDTRDGRLKLLEVNPRFWGSLALAVRSGVNFPSLLVKWARGSDPGRPRAYKTGVRCRWLIPGDALHFLSNPGRFRLEPSFFEFVKKGLFYDDLDPRDPWPALGTLLSGLPFMLDPGSRRFFRR